ncbi:hypothetical protein PQ478_08570 [Alkalihalophilus pseudofirmus]|uniref:hypothetical protein n=1 Tax=Alkalihalophilus pseudofirmus TaxID=79885 RepID=UPI00259BB371|nr:hypothetical protein [Alkalihalophilus pseudofirmus]WEG18522.1 hypothetical protein PQ478_08570 [Alkalihalophilus pseudofirmus]
MKLNKVKWSIKEIVAYLEEKILNDEATYKEIDWYIDYKNTEEVSYDRVLKTLLDEMQSEYWIGGVGR